MSSDSITLRVTLPHTIAFKHVCGFSGSTWTTTIPLAAGDTLTAYEVRPYSHRANDSRRERKRVYDKFMLLMPTVRTSDGVMHSGGMYSTCVVYAHAVEFVQ